MKKLLSLLIFLVIFATAAVIFKDAREEKRVYEHRIVAAVDVIKKSLQSVAVGENLGVDVLAPGVDLQEARGSWVVTGIVGLSRVGGSELFDQFVAVIRNDCGAVIDTTCLWVDTLTVRGSKLIAAGKVVAPIPDMSLNPTKNAARAAPVVDQERVGQPAQTEAVRVGQAAQTEAVRAGQPAQTEAVRAGKPAQTGAVRAGQPAQTGAVRVGQPAQTGAVRVGKPAQTGAVRAGQPAKAGPPPSAPPITKSVSRPRPAAPGPAAPQRAGTPADNANVRLRVIKIQRTLKRLGYNPGPVDNVIGARTRRAIIAYQRHYGLTRDGIASLKLLRHMKSLKGTQRPGAHRN